MCVHAVVIQMVGNRECVYVFFARVCVCWERGPI